jgi:hypothetical protein
LITDNRPEPTVAPALTFVPVNVTEEPAAVESGDEARPARRRKVSRGSTIIEIELKCGDRVRVEGSADAALLARIVAALRRA